MSEISNNLFSSYFSFFFIWGRVIYVCIVYGTCGCIPMTKFNTQQLISNYPNCTCINLNGNKPIQQIVITQTGITLKGITLKGIARKDITLKVIALKGITWKGITREASRLKASGEKESSWKASRKKPGIRREALCHRYGSDIPPKVKTGKKSKPNKKSHNNSYLE